MRSVLMFPRIPLLLLSIPHHHIVMLQLSLNIKYFSEHCLKLIRRVCGIVKVQIIIVAVHSDVQQSDHARGNRVVGRVHRAIGLRLLKQLLIFTFQQFISQIPVLDRKSVV